MEIKISKGVLQGHFGRENNAAALVRNQRKKKGVALRSCKERLNAPNTKGGYQKRHARHFFVGNTTSSRSVGGVSTLRCFYRRIFSFCFRSAMYCVGFCCSQFLEQIGSSCGSGLGIGSTKRVRLRHCFGIICSRLFRECFYSCT